VDQALIGLAGVFVGAALGGTGKYFTTRRDRWLVARASGLILLADTQAILASRAQVEGIDISPLLASWQAKARSSRGFAGAHIPAVSRLRNGWHWPPASLASRHSMK
jgi:hypothetical protein